jgi:septum formation protein
VSEARPVSGPPPLVLASASPRRAECLRMLGLSFEVQPADVPETVRHGESADAFVERLARDKATAVASLRPDEVVLGGDTVVSLDGEILGKPSGPEEAEAMLLRLAGRTHSVASGLALALPSGDVRSGVSTTQVTFRDFSPRFARAYVATGEPLDKAGAYGIQGLGAALVTEIQGDYYSVVGLPVALLMRLFEESGWAHTFESPARPHFFNVLMEGC